MGFLLPAVIICSVIAVLSLVIKSAANDKMQKMFFLVIAFIAMLTSMVLVISAGDMEITVNSSINGTTNVTNSTLAYAVPTTTTDVIGALYIILIIILLLAVLLVFGVLLKHALEMFGGSLG